MRTLAIDFAPVHRRRSSSRLVMLIAAGALALAAVALHSELQSEAARLDARLSRLESSGVANAGLPVRIDEDLERKVRQANELIDRLALPWDRLFGAVEGAATSRVVLLGIAPDARAGTVQITGEAAAPEAMFDYVKQLEQQPELARVFLLQHKVEERRPGQPLRFVAIGSWIEPQAK
jgi:hypothetical protein